jgi:hypothetical protein
MLPSKTIPDVKNRKRHVLKPKTKMTAATAAPPRKKARLTSGHGTEVEVIGDEDSPHTGRNSGDAAARGTNLSAASSFEVSYPVKVRNVL